MADAWQILRDGGLPLAMAASGERWSPADLASAIRAAITERPAGRDAEALAAYVLAWQQHWPTTYATALGEEGDAVSHWARLHAVDPDRYLKLRRIALENLARIL